MSVMNPRIRVSPFAERSTVTTSRSHTTWPSAAIMRVLKLMIPPVPHRIHAELGAPLHVVRMRVTAPEVRLVDPLADGIPEDRFGVGADEEELKRLGIGFPDNGAERLDEAREV